MATTKQATLEGDTAPAKDNFPRRKSSGEAFNDSFLTPANNRWYFFVKLNWLPDINKPLVFLPCASAAKTRKEGDGRKFISHSTSHQLMSAATRNDDLTKVILSEPLVVIPYELEGIKEPVERPDYNIPPEALSIQSEWIFIDRLSSILQKIKLHQPTRKVIYYVGSTHHYFILHFANVYANEPFRIVYSIPERGTAEYAKAAKALVAMIHDLEEDGIEPDLRPMTLDDLINKRGSYTRRKFWLDVKTGQVAGKDTLRTGHMKITTKGDLRQGFKTFYEPEKMIESRRDERQ